MKTLRHKATNYYLEVMGFNPRGVWWQGPGLPLSLHGILSQGKFPYVTSLRPCSLSFFTMVCFYITYGKRTALTHTWVSKGGGTQSALCWHFWKAGAEVGFSGMTSRVHQSAGLGKALSPLTSLCLEHLAPFNPSVLTLESGPGSPLLPKLWPLSVSTATVADSCHHSCYNLWVFPPRPPGCKSFAGRDL